MIPQSLSPQMIFPRGDARPVDRATVKALAASITEIGLLSPIRVRWSGEGANGIAGKRYEVLAGNHRLQACLMLGLDEIPCIIVDDDDLHAELAMIDENLCRAELSPADRAEQTARRKAIYEALHPETKQHVAGAHASNAAQGNAAAKLAVASFTSSTSGATGKSERAVQRDAERGERVCASALALVRGTFLDTGAYLDKLKALAIDEQVDCVTRDLAKGKPKPAAKSTPARDLPIIKDADDVEDDQKRALLNAWNKASEGVRRWFREEVVDSPIMDAA